MKTHRYVRQIKSSKYYTNENLYHNYQDDLGLIVFLTSLDNILNDIHINKCIGIRYKEQKELLGVLIFILDNYKLYKLNSIYLSGNCYTNKYHNKIVGPREALVSSLIYELKKNLGYIDYNSYNLCLDFLNNHSCWLFSKNLGENKIRLELKKELDFSGEYSLSENGNINNKYFYNS